MKTEGHALHAAFRDHAIPFRATSAAPDDFSDLEGLRPVLERRRVVLLGEHSHGDGAAFAVKSRLVRFLHRELGFDVIAFEAGIFDCMAARRALQGSTIEEAKAPLRRALPEIWSHCAQVAPLIAEIADASRPRPLELVGFDSQLGDIAQDRLAEDMGALLVGSGVCTPREWDIFRPVVSALANADSGTSWPAEEDRVRVLALLRESERALGSQPQDASARLWARVLASTHAQAVSEWSPEMLTKRWREPYMLRREIEMGRNLCWWAAEEYPTRRIAVWAHQGHLLRNVRDVPAWSDWHAVAPTAGEAVWEALPGQVYTIGFSACTGQFGRVGRPTPASVRPPSQDSIEGAMWSTGHEAVLLDFTSVPESVAALRSCACRLKGLREAVIEPRRHLDGLIILREMEPAREFLDRAEGGAT